MSPPDRKATGRVAETPSPVVVAAREISPGARPVGGADAPAVADLSSWFGTVLGIGVLLAGHFLGGGAIGQIFQPVSALVVLGGTLAAVLLAYPASDLRRAGASIRGIYSARDPGLADLGKELLRVATIARKEGLLALEQHRMSVGDPLLRRTLKFVIDGFDAGSVSEIIEAQAELELERDEAAARVFEGAGAFAPAIGIVGAVLGLIQVMYQLGDPARIGEGLAAAFVSTVYGVALSNLVLIPWGTKLRRKAESIRMVHEMALTGIRGIQEGISPHLLEEKLEVFARRAPGADRAKKTF